MAKIEDLELTGASGTRYQFEVYPRNQTFNAVGAVYAVTKRTLQVGQGIHDVLYIGETGDLSTRFADHHKNDCFDRHGANCICTHVDASEASRLRKEADLVAKYGPICNG
jgi:hypothetical protein